MCLVSVTEDDRLALGRAEQPGQDADGRRLAHFHAGMADAVGLGSRFAGRMYSRLPFFTDIGLQLSLPQPYFEILLP